MLDMHEVEHRAKGRMNTKNEPSDRKAEAERAGGRNRENGPDKAEH